MKIHQLKKLVISHKTKIERQLTKWEYKLYRLKGQTKTEKKHFKKSLYHIGSILIRKINPAHYRSSKKPSLSKKDRQKRNIEIRKIKEKLKAEFGQVKTLYYLDLVNNINQEPQKIKSNEKQEIYSVDEIEREMLSSFFDKNDKELYQILQDLETEISSKKMNLKLMKKRDLFLAFLNWKLKDDLQKIKTVEDLELGIFSFDEPNLGKQKFVLIIDSSTMTLTGIAKEISSNKKLIKKKRFNKFRYKLKKIKNHFLNNIVLYITILTSLLVLSNQISIGMPFPIESLPRFFTNDKTFIKLTDVLVKNKLIKVIIETSKRNSKDIVQRKIKILVFEEPNQFQLTKEEMKSILQKKVHQEGVEISIKTSVDVLIEKIKNS